MTHRALARTSMPSKRSPCRPGGNLRANTARPYPLAPAAPGAREAALRAERRTRRGVARANCAYSTRGAQGPRQSMSGADESVSCCGRLSLWRNTPQTRPEDHRSILVRPSRVRDGLDWN